MRDTIILYYNYTNIDDPEALRVEQLKLCTQLGLKGRIIIAKEGINGTLQGTKEATDQYVEALKSDPRFADTHMKYSHSDIDAFPKLSIKVRGEIVSGHLGQKDVNPKQVTGKYITAEELHDWIHSDKEFYIVDMRNDYEHEVGYFKDSILAPFKNFRDLPESLSALEHLKGKTIVTVCTGGVRCEKASGFLVANGFADVYQLYGGIVTYMEKYPNQDFLGKLYVFDGRVTMGFNTESAEHVKVGKCFHCGAAADVYLDCAYIHCTQKRHFISCEDCIAKGETDGGLYCSEECIALDTQVKNASLGHANLAI